MSISINSASFYTPYTQGLAGTANITKSLDKTDALEDKLSNINAEEATDEELMEACKSFETYFTEQVFKEMQKTVHSSDQEGEYMQYFGDILAQEYAQNITDTGELGIAQMLYDSMKRNS